MVLPRFEPLLSPLRSLPETVMIGLSGGMDSTSLLHALLLVDKKPILLHLDHGWRAESKNEAKTLQRLAEKLNLPFYTQRVSVKIPKTETAARTARDEFFKTAALHFKNPHLVLAHHANDQVETFLLQLLRGSGSQASGMSALSKRDGIVRYRPWLSVWKKEIEAFAQAQGLSWFEDSSNQDTQHRRNWIRYELLPLLDQKMGRSISPLLHRTADLLRDQTEALTQEIEPLIPHPTLSVDDLKKLSIAKQRLLIKRWLTFHEISEIDFEIIEKITRFITQKSPAKINLSKGHFARRTGGKIWIQRHSKKTTRSIK